jgi:hypothetical protein
VGGSVRPATATSWSGGPDGPKYPIPHNEQAQIVKYVFDRVIAGASTREDRTGPDSSGRPHGPPWRRLAQQPRTEHPRARPGCTRASPSPEPGRWAAQEHELEPLAYPPDHHPLPRSASGSWRPARRKEDESPCGVTCSVRQRGRNVSQGCKVPRATTTPAGRSMGLPHQEDFCRHAVDHRLIVAELLRYIGESGRGDGSVAVRRSRPIGPSSCWRIAGRPCCRL